MDNQSKLDIVKELWKFRDAKLCKFSMKITPTEIMRLSNDRKKNGRCLVVTAENEKDSVERVYEVLKLYPDANNQESDIYVIEGIDCGAVQ